MEEFNSGLIITVSAIIGLILGYLIALWRMNPVKDQLLQNLTMEKSVSTEYLDSKIELEQELLKLKMKYEDISHKKKLSDERVYEHKAEMNSTHERLKEHRYQLREKNSQLELERQTLKVLMEQLSDAREKSKAYEVNLEKTEKQFQETQEILEAKQQELTDLNNRYHQLSEEQLGLQVRYKEKESHFDQQLELLEKSKLDMKMEFEELASKIFEKKDKNLHESNQKSIDAMLNPFKKQMDTFKAKIEDIHYQETQQQNHLQSELEQLKVVNHQITRETHSIASALQGQNKVSGNWGELVLEKILDRAGLVEGRDFRCNVSFGLEDEQKAKPDVVINLPQDKYLVIDTGLPMDMYSRFINASNETERLKALEAYVGMFVQRITELSEFDYYDVEGLHSPQMVFMFVPIEAAYVEAVKYEEGLFERALHKNILIATPSTLSAGLSIVRHLWHYEKQNQYTVELAKSADLVFKKLNTFLGGFRVLKKTLQKANEAYDRAEGQLISGSENLVKRVSEFKQFTPLIKGELPKYFKEKAELGIDYLPLGDEIGAVLTSDAKEKDPVFNIVEGS